MSTSFTTCLGDGVPLLDDEAELAATEKVDLGIARVAFVPRTESQGKLDNAVGVLKLVPQRYLRPPIPVGISTDSLGRPVKH